VLTQGLPDLFVLGLELLWRWVRRHLDAQKAQAFQPTFDSLPELCLHDMEQDF
jgi:hypothetical protein